MKDFKERRAVHTLLSSWWLLALLLVISAWLGQSAIKAYQQARAARAERKHLEAQILELAERRQALERKLEGFAEGEGIEEEARKKLFLKKPEEDVIIIVE